MKGVRPELAPEADRSSHAVQRTWTSHSGCNPHVRRDGSLSLSRWLDMMKNIVVVSLLVACVLANDCFSITRSTLQLPEKHQVVETKPVPVEGGGTKEEPTGKKHTAFWIWPAVALMLPPCIVLDIILSPAEAKDAPHIGGF